MTERRYSGIEVRAEGRRLVGPAMRYGDISPSHLERFEPGAFALDGRTRWLDLDHDPTRVIAFTGAGLDLRDGPDALMVDATLPKLPLADFALQAVRDGSLRGFSVEFAATAERRDSGIRVIEKADLAGIGLVADPSYQQSTVETRARSGRTLRSTIPTDADVDCECQGGGCTRARLLKTGFDEMWERVFKEGTRTVAAAYLNNYAGPLASTARGTLRGRIAGVGRYEVDIDIPDSEVGRALLAAWEDSGIVVRPFVSDAEGPVIDGVRHIERGRLRAFIVSATDARDGWPEPDLLPSPERIEPRDRGRVRVWL